MRLINFQMLVYLYLDHNAYIFIVIKTLLVVMEILIIVITIVCISKVSKKNVNLHCFLYVHIDYALFGIIFCALMQSK